MPQASERLVLIPAINKRNTTGYNNVTFNLSRNRLVPHWFSPPATSWGHSKCRGRLARDGPSPRVAAVRLGPWVQSEDPRLSLGRGGEPRAHSVPRSPIFPRPHSSAIADTSLPHALTLLLLGYSSKTWWHPVWPAQHAASRRYRARPYHRSPPRRHARALHRSNAREYSDRRAHPLRRRRSCDRNAAPRRAHRTQRRLPVGRGTPAHAYHIGHIVPQAFGSPMRHGARRRAHARRRAGGELHGIRRGVGVDHGVPRRKTHAVRRLKTSEAVCDS